MTFDTVVRPACAALTSACFFLTILILASCSADPEEVIISDREIEGIISSYTSGIVSSETDVQVRFTNPVPEQARELRERRFSFSPRVSGTEEWIDDRTLRFVPDSPLSSGTEYTVTIGLGGLHPEKEKSSFRFGLRVMNQDLEVTHSGLEPYRENGYTYYRLRGVVSSADVLTSEKLRSVLDVRVNGERRYPKWESENRRRASFVVEGIERKAEAGSVRLSWDGRGVGAAVRGEKQIAIPPLSVFELSELRVLRHEGPAVELIFTDRIDDSANLRGLITFDGMQEPGIVVRNNRILVYPRGAEPGEYVMRVSSGIRNSDGKRLASDLERTITLADLPPEVRLLGSGVILPESDELLMPFEAVNLGAVDVQVTRIFESNIPQFLQFNRLGDGGGIQQVGRPVVQQVLPLSSLGDVEAGEWNSYALDLSKIMRPEPGAIYRVTIGFREHQSLYPCTETVTSARQWTLDSHEEQEYWDNFERLWVFGTYNWRDRDDPCTPSYYTADRRVHRNALASGIGLIAKRGEVSGLKAFVTGLVDAKPLSGVELKLLDYRHQQIARGKSGRDGSWHAEYETGGPEPYLLVASRGEERAFLRVDDASSLSVSDFDVSGTRADEGIKGFMYAERGVWRPGDSLFVNLMIEADAKRLPEKHPAAFELTDPSGSVVARRNVIPKDRIYSFPARLPADGETGRWQVRARLGGNTFTHAVNVETIMPNRLRVEIEPDESLLTGEEAILSGELFSEWLHGATASRLEADMTLTMREGTLRFSDFRDYRFSDPSKSMERSEQEFFSGNIDETGRVRYSGRLVRPESAPGMIDLLITARVFEPSGAFSTGRTGLRYIPHDLLTGISLSGIADDQPVFDYDSNPEFNMVVVDPDGNIKAGENITLEIFELDWRWWWQRRSENLSQYFSGRNLEPVLSRSVRTGTDGKASVQLDSGRLDYGRYLVRASAGGSAHSAGSIFFIGWGTGHEQAGSPARLALETDRDSYEPGDDITLKFPGSRQGRALVSIENGSEVLQTRWVETDAGINEVKIRATPEMSPNIYAYVHVIQPHAQRDNDLPVRMYGIKRVAVEDPATRLSPVVKMLDELRPGSVAEIRISEESGRKMSYTIAIVDEGLLDLTNFRTPDPHRSFYATEALGIRTFDLYDDVAGSYAGSMNRILAVGGDLELEERPDETELSRFTPVVRFLGPFTLEAGSENTHRASIPNYVGSVRTMVVAGHDRSYGHKDVRTPVRQPLMLLGTLPRVLSPGEQVVLPVSVFVMSDAVRDVSLRLRTGELFSLPGDSERSLRFETPGESLQRFSLEVARETGTGSVRIDAESGAESAFEQIETVIRNPNPPVIQVFDHTVNPGEPVTFSYDPAGYDGSNSAVLEISSIPPLDLSRHMNYLNRYPHRSLEHRISSVFPRLFLHRITGGDSPGENDRAAINAFISDIERYRLPSGGFVMWRGQSVENEWLSSYALHFLVEAERAGYAVPGSLKQDAIRFQRRAAGNWRHNPDNPSRFDLIQAYRLYTLARSGNPETGAMNRLRERDGLSVQARWRLALAYYAAGMPEAAESLISGVTVEVSPYTEDHGTYGSDVRDKAMILETLSSLGRTDQAARVMRDLSRSLTDDSRLPPQTVAFAVIAAARFADNTTIAETVDVRYALSSLGEGSLSGDLPLTRLPFDISGTQQQTAEIENRGEGVVFARLVQEGLTLEDSREPVSSDLDMRVRYLYPNGESVDPSSLRQGTDIIAEVRVSNPGTRGNLRELALTQIMPSGWEISNTRLDDLAWGEPASTGRHQDIRDDRVLTYFDLAAGESVTFRTRVTATYEGQFIKPAVQVQALYDNSVFARTAASRVEVVRP